MTPRLSVAVNICLSIFCYVLYIYMYIYIKIYYVYIYKYILGPWMFQVCFLKTLPVTCICQNINIGSSTCFLKFPWAFLLKYLEIILCVFNHLSICLLSIFIAKMAIKSSNFNAGFQRWLELSAKNHYEGSVNDTRASFTGLTNPVILHWGVCVWCCCGN